MNWSDLDLNSKSKLMELYLKNGITSLTAMKEHYNSLQDGGKLTFKQWKEKMQQKYPDIEMDNNKAGYDYETYFNDNYNEAVAQLNNLRHFPDTYKLYNHPTFSNESIYSRGPMIGGSWGYAHPWDTQWSNTEGFTPSIVNRQVHPEIYKEDRPYTEEEIYSHRFNEGGPIKDIINEVVNKIKANIKNNNINVNNQNDNGIHWKTKQDFIGYSYDKWFNILNNNGYSNIAHNLAYYLTMQDAMESGYGFSNAAIEHNNLGGHKYKGQIIHYNTLDDYYNTKWSDIQNKYYALLNSNIKDFDTFYKALNANKNYQYAPLEENPNYVKNLQGMLSAKKWIQQHRVNAYPDIKFSDGGLLKSKNKKETMKTIF